MTDPPPTLGRSVKNWPVTTSAQHKAKKGAYREARIVGALILVGIGCVCGWAYFDARRKLQEIHEEVATWTDLPGSMSGAQLHMHDTYYVIANPGWTTAAIVGIGIGFALLFAPRVLHSFWLKKRNTEPVGDAKR